MELDSEETESDVRVKLEPCTIEGEVPSERSKEQSLSSNTSGIVLDNIALETEQYESDPELQMVIDEEAREFSKFMSSANEDTECAVVENIEETANYELALSNCYFRGAQNNYEKLLLQLQARLPEDEHTVANNTFVCDLCSKSFSKLQNFTLHVTALHKNTKLSIACEENENTRKIIATRIADSDVPPPLVPLKSKKVINITNEATSSGLRKPRFQCHLCNKVFGYARNLQTHLALKTLYCCGKPFSSCIDKELHIIRGHIDPDDKLFCKCGTILTNAKERFLHQKTCLEQTPVVVFICSICKAAFNTESNLDNHLATVHTVSSDQIVPYLKTKQCVMCKNPFVGSHNLHYCPLRKDRFACEHCGRGFQTSLLLKVHKRALGDLVKCEQCQQLYTKCELPKHNEECCLTDQYIKSLNNCTRVRVTVTGDLVEFDPSKEGARPSGTKDDVMEVTDTTVKVKEDMLEIVDNPINVINYSEEVVANPEKLDINPEKIDANQVKVSASSVKIDANPVKVRANPVKVSANPVKVSANPVKVSANPKTIDASPANIAAKRIVTKPINIAPKPMQPKPIRIAGNPVIITAHSINIGAGQFSIVTSPSKVAPEIGKIASSPVKVVRKIKKIASTQVKVAPKIDKIPTTPVKIAPYPENIATDPMKMATDPIKIATNPTNMATNPQKIITISKKIIYPIKIAPKPTTIVANPVSMSTSPVKAADNQIKIANNQVKPSAKLVKITANMKIAPKPLTIAPSATMTAANALKINKSSVKSATYPVWTEDRCLVTTNSKIKVENDEAVSNFVKTEPTSNTSPDVIEIDDSDEETQCTANKEAASSDASNKKNCGYRRGWMVDSDVETFHIPIEKLHPVILGKRKRRICKKRIEWFQGPNESWDKEVEEEALYQREQEELRRNAKKLKRSKKRGRRAMDKAKEVPKRATLYGRPKMDYNDEPPSPEPESSEESTDPDDIDIPSYNHIETLAEPKREIVDIEDARISAQPTDVVVKTEVIEPIREVVVKTEPDEVVIKSEVLEVEEVTSLATQGSSEDPAIGQGEETEWIRERRGGQMRRRAVGGVIPAPKSRKHTRPIAGKLVRECGLQVYVCEKCRMSFLTPEHLRQHLAESHNIAENIDRHAHMDNENMEDLAASKAVTINLQSMRSKLSQKIAAYQQKATEPSTSDEQGLTESISRVPKTASFITVKEEPQDLISDEAEEPMAVVKQEPDDEILDSSADYEDDIIVLQPPTMKEKEYNEISIDESNILEIASVLKQKKLQQMNTRRNGNKKQTRSSTKDYEDTNESETEEGTNSNKKDFVTIVKCEPKEDSDDSEYMPVAAGAEAAHQIITAKDQLLMLDMTEKQNRRRPKKRKKTNPNSPQKNKISYNELKHRLKVPHRRHLRELLKQCEKCTLKFPPMAYQRHIDECKADVGVVARSNVKKRDRLVMPQRSILKDYKKFSCSSCGEEYYNFVSYCDHWQLHGYTENTCPVCKEQYDDKKKFAAHINKHMCQSYLQIYYIKDLKKSDTSNRYTRVCRMCKVQIQSDRVIQHWEEHVLNDHHMLKIKLKRERVSKQVEPTPARQLIDEATIAGIMQELLTETPKVNSERYYYGSTRIVVKNRRCLVCDKMFARPGDVKRHYVEHLIANSIVRRQELMTTEFPCDLCPLQTGSKFELKAHLREHAGLTQYNCHVCNKSFADSSNFAKHKKVHGLTAMVCDICGRKFNTRRMIEKHMAFHLSNSPLQCAHCERVFFFRSALQKHEKMAHSTEATVRCGYCDVVVRTHRQKWDHEWEEHGLRKFDADCPCCPKKFRTFSKIRQHLRNEHNIRFNKDDYDLVSLRKLKSPRKPFRESAATDDE